MQVYGSWLHTTLIRFIVRPYMLLSSRNTQSKIVIKMSNMRLSSPLSHSYILSSRPGNLVRLKVHGLYFREVSY